MSERVHNILQISTGAELGGAERVLLDVVRTLDRRRFRVHVLVPRFGRLAEALRAAGIPTLIAEYWGRGHRLGRYSSWREYARALLSLPQVGGQIRAIARRANEMSVAVIHAHGIKAQMFSVGLAPLVRARIIWHVHDFLRHRRFWRIFQTLARLVPDLLIVPSHAVAREFPRWENVRIIPNGVDLEEFAPSSPRRAAGSRRVGMIGALAPWKGHFVFLQAAERVSRVLPDVEFLIVGDEIYDTTGHRGFRQAVEREVARRGLSSRVHFTGFCADIVPILQKLDVVVHCSLEPEPFGRVLVEAMACGVPVVAARGGATEEIVRDGESGLLVPPGDAECLAEAILTLLRDPSQLAEMGRSARAQAECAFDLREQVRRIEELYESLLA